MAHEDLKESDVPLPDAGWYEIGKFALSFNGYDRWGSFERCAEIANAAARAFHDVGTLPDSLIGLRTCLFFEQRRWHHFGYDPDESAMFYISALLGAIRRRVPGTKGTEEE